MVFGSERGGSWGLYRRNADGTGEAEQLVSDQDAQVLFPNTCVPGGETLVVARPVDTRADIWAFGAVLFEMLTGQRLFGGETVAEVLASVLKTNPDWSLLHVDVSDPVRRLFRRSLKKNRRRRMPDIVDALLELEDARTRPDSALDTPQKGRVRRLVPVVLGSSIAAAVLAGVGVWMITRTAPLPGPAPTRSRWHRYRTRIWPPGSASPCHKTVARLSLATGRDDSIAARRPTRSGAHFGNCRCVRALLLSRW